MPDSYTYGLVDAIQIYESRELNLDMESLGRQIGNATQCIVIERCLNESSP